MTLPEFLTARIAEDEAVARDFDSEEVDNPPIERQRWVRARNEWVTLYDPTRVLAECEAKRQIVSDHDSVHECPSGPNLVSDPSYEDGTYGGPCGTLRALAAVYADHPDYPGNGA